MCENITVNAWVVDEKASCTFHALAKSCIVSVYCEPNAGAHMSEIRRMVFIIVRIGFRIN